MITKLDDRVELNNGIKIPGLGLGVFKIPNEETAETVKTAIKNGYRLIDTATIYGNEEGVGQGITEALKENNLKREDVFVTSKVWNDHLSYDETIKAFEESLNKLGLNYLDLYLIHWPGINAYKESYQALEDLYNEGKIKAIGVSNFEISHLEDLKKFAKVMPVINQVELNPKNAQKELRKYAEENNILLQAWSPLIQGKLLDNEVILQIAKKHGKTPAQVILRWLVEQDLLFNVKSTKEERMISNSQIFDFNLDREDMDNINNLNEDLRVGPNPKTFDFEV